MKSWLHGGGPPCRCQRPQNRGPPAECLPGALPSLGTRGLQGPGAGPRPVRRGARRSRGHSPLRKSNHGPRLRRRQPPGDLRRSPPAASAAEQRQLRPLPPRPLPAPLTVYSRPHFQHRRAANDRLCQQAKATGQCPPTLKSASLEDVPTALPFLSGQDCFPPPRSVSNRLVPVSEPDFKKRGKKKNTHTHAVPF